jgi:hypothetical protein
MSEQIVAGFVYLCQARDYFKIGKSQDPQVRVTQILTPWGRPALLHTIASARPRWLEKVLHHHFLTRHIIGEWFRLRSEAIPRIRSLARCDDWDGLPSWLTQQDDSPGVSQEPSATDETFIAWMEQRPSQLNIRLSEEGEARLASLMASMSATLGIKVSQADVVHAALAELEKRYPPLKEPEAPPPAAEEKPRRRGRKKEKE